MKTSKVILNMDTTLKKDLMAKARKEGMNLSTVLNITARGYIANKIRISASDRDFEEGMADIRAGRVRPAEEVFKRLGLS
jgi:predicted transcriptional regulator